MEKSSVALRLLKILSIAGITVQLGLICVTILVRLRWGQTTEHVWFYLWFQFSLGLPLFALLFVGVKMREHLKAIEGALSAKR
jgi:hypothetical protein